MKKISRYLPIVFLCTALFTGYATKAQAEFKPKSTSVPSKIKGNWALPDCRSYEEALIITSHFYLKSTKEGSQFWPVESLGKSKDYWTLTIEGTKHPVRREPDGVMKIGVLSDKAPEQWPKTWDALLLDAKHEYMSCSDIPALLPDPLVRVMVHIDEIQQLCSTRLSGACKHLLFSIADADKNNMISFKEMKMAGAMLAGFAALIQDNNVSRASLDKTLYESLRESETVARTMMEEDAELTYRDFRGFLSNTHSTTLLTVLMDVGDLFPAFKQAAEVMANGK